MTGASLVSLKSVEKKGQQLADEPCHLFDIDDDLHRLTEFDGPTEIMFEFYGYKVGSEGIEVGAEADKVAISAASTTTRHKSTATPARPKQQIDFYVIDTGSENYLLPKR